MKTILAGILVVVVLLAFPLHASAQSYWFLTDPSTHTTYGQYSSLAECQVAQRSVPNAQCIRVGGGESSAGPEGTPTVQVLSCAFTIVKRADYSAIGKAHTWVDVTMRVSNTGNETVDAGTFTLQVGKQYVGYFDVVASSFLSVGLHAVSPGTHTYTAKGILLEGRDGMAWWALGEALDGSVCRLVK